MTIVRANFRPLKVVVRKADGMPVKTVDCEIDHGLQSSNSNYSNTQKAERDTEEKQYLGADVLDFARFRMH